jgi:hypothetical protein
MRTTVGLAAVLALSRSTPAAAWDGPGLWYADADDATPGGGGILGTGGAHDHGITCADCHVDRDPEVIDLRFQFSPAMGTVGPDLVYTPGRRYRVDVQLLNATLGPPCGPYMDNRDLFAASFETMAGSPAGVLESDSGQSTSNCPVTYPDPAPPGTTGLAKDCAVIFALGTPNLTQWTFYWTAPSSGAVELFYGGVDGDCDMMSMGDAVVTGTRVLRAPMAAATPAETPAETRDRSDDHGSPLRYAMTLSLAALGLVVLPRARRRPHRAHAYSSCRATKPAVPSP